MDEFQAVLDMGAKLDLPGMLLLAAFLFYRGVIRLGRDCDRDTAALQSVVDKLLADAEEDKNDFREMSEKYERVYEEMRRELWRTRDTRNRPTSGAD